MYEFTYRNPGSVDEAVAQLTKAEDGRPLAGGMSLIPTFRFRLSSASDLVDLNGIDELAGIGRRDDTISIGAMTRHVAVATSPDVANAIPALAALAGSIGDVQVRNRGTIGGSICFADPAADYPAGLLGLGATVNTDRRSIAADDFFVGLYETALEDGEIVVSVDFPVPEKAGWAKFGNQASRFAVVAVMVSFSGGAARVAVTGAKSHVFRVAEIEAALAADFSPGALDRIAIPDDDLNEDLHADKEYRAHLVTVMAKRAVEAAVTS
jgi:carbon-monoxide dehydrogenase medium subunit